MSQENKLFGKNDGKHSKITLKLVTTLMSFIAATQFIAITSSIAVAGPSVHEITLGGPPSNFSLDAFNPGVDYYFGIKAQGNPGSAPSPVARGFYTNIINAQSSSNYSKIYGCSNSGTPSCYQLSATSPAHLYVGDYNLYHYMLIGEPDGRVDLEIFTGPTSSYLTQQSTEALAELLKGPFALRNSELSAGLKYDCTEFDSSGLCISGGVGFNRVNSSPVNSSNNGLLILSKLLSPTSRVGVWVSQNFNNNPGAGANVQVKNSTPMFGAYGVWNDNQTGLGFELRLAAAYGQESLDLTRPVPYLNWSEPGHGVSDLKTYGLSAVGSYNMKLSQSALVAPYVGIKYTNLSLQGYKEDHSVEVPLTFSKLTDDNVIGVLGLKLMGKVTQDVGLSLSLGLEEDLNKKTGYLNASGMDGLSPVAFNPNRKTSRFDSDASVWYEFERAGRLTLSGSYMQSPYTSLSGMNWLVSYTVGY